MSIKKLHKKITQLTKYHKNTDFKFSSNKSSELAKKNNDEFNASLTQAEKDAPYYTDWSNKRLGELAILNFKTITNAFEKIEHANTKSIISICHILQENNINNFNIDLHLEAIYTNVGGHFISFNIQKMSREEKEINDTTFDTKINQGIQEEIIEQKTDKPKNKRKLIEGSLYNSV